MRHSLRITMLCLLGMLCIAGTTLAYAGHVTINSSYMYFTERSPGSNCVRETASVGDLLKLPDGTITTIQALTGKSSVCNEPEFPILAKVGTSKTCAISPPFNANSGIYLPDGWVQVKQNCALAAKKYFFFATNKNVPAALLISDRPRSETPDMKAFVNAKRSEQMANVESPQSSDIEELVINDRPAWRFTVNGTVKATKVDSTFLITIIDGGKEMVMLLVYAPKDKFAANEQELRQLADGVNGLMD